MGGINCYRVTEKSLIFVTKVTERLRFTVYSLLFAITGLAMNAGREENF